MQNICNILSTSRITHSSESNFLKETGIMEIQQILGYLLNTAARMIKRAMDDNLSKYNITTSQWAVLKLLDSKPGLTQTEIARALSADKATAGEVILRLSEKDYLKKSVNERDKRSYSVSLTPKA